MTLLELKEEMIKKALLKHDNSITKAAKQLGLSTRTIHNYIIKFKTEEHEYVPNT